MASDPLQGALAETTPEFSVEAENCSVLPIDPLRLLQGQGWQKGICSASLHLSEHRVHTDSQERPQLFYPRHEESGGGGRGPGTAAIDRRVGHGATRGDMH